MTTIDSVEVFPSVLRNRRFDVSWRGGSTDYPMDKIRFSAEWAERESGPWTPAIEPAAGITGVDGVGPESKNHSPSGFVRVVAFAPSSSERIAESPAFTLGPRMESRELLEYRDHLRRENLSLSKFTGVRTAIHQRASMGCPCLECADEILGGAPDSHCPRCYGTGIDGGYLPPVSMMVDWSSEARGSGTRVDGALGVSEPESRVIRVFPFPSLASKDILIQDGSESVWEVVSVQPVIWKAWPVARRATVKMLPKGDPASKLIRRGSR